MSVEHIIKHLKPYKTIKYIKPLFKQYSMNLFNLNLNFNFTKSIANIDTNRHTRIPTDQTYIIIYYCYMTTWYQK